MTRDQANRVLNAWRDDSIDFSHQHINRALRATGDLASTWDKQPSDPMRGEAWSNQHRDGEGEVNTHATDRVAPGSSTLQP